MSVFNHIVGNAATYTPSLGYQLDMFDDKDYNVQNVQDLNGIYDAIHSDTQKVWEREDSAYQRMVADMKKAGLNPWSGISTGGLSTSSSSPTSEAMKGLLSVLEYNRKVSDDVRKSDQFFFNGLTKLLNIMSNFSTGVLRAVN